MVDTMKLRNLIKEGPDDWTDKDIIDTAKALVLAKKSLIGAIRNLEKLENILAKSKNKPQGSVLHSMLPGRRQIKMLGLPLAKLDKLDKSMGAEFTKAWAALKKKK
jgi:hypothetical protein